jgi:hypothetical protein
LKLRKRNGTKWKDISKEIKGYDPIALKNHYYTYVRK